MNSSDKNKTTRSHKSRLLRRAIEADQLSSIIFAEPPGTGKTTLARIIANTTRAHLGSD